MTRPFDPSFGWVVVLSLVFLAVPARADLWSASYQERETPQTAYVLIPIETIANPLAVDLVANAFGTSLDLGSTDWATHRDRGCFEGNGLVPRPESRIAAKIALAGIRGGLAYILRRTGHARWATGLRIGGAVIDLAATVNNIACGFKDRK